MADVPVPVIRELDAGAIVDNCIDDLLLMLNGDCVAIDPAKLYGDDVLCAVVPSVLRRPVIVDVVGVDATKCRLKFVDVVA